MMDRRQFLKKGAAVVAVAPLVPLASISWTETAYVQQFPGGITWVDPPIYVPGPPMTATEVLSLRDRYAKDAAIAYSRYVDNLISAALIG